MKRGRDGTEVGRDESNRITYRFPHQYPPIVVAELREGTTSTKDKAFYHSTTLFSISIPASVRVIGERVFYSCRELSTVVLREGLETIGDGAFAYCSSIESISIPGSVRVIGNSAFRGCGELSSVVLREGLETIGRQAFAHCSSIVSISIPASVRELGAGAFFYCTSLSSVVLREGLETFGPYAFAHCYSLTSIVIPDSITNIGHNTFYGSTLLETNARAAGLSIEQWGRSNWRKWKRIETRFVIASTVKKLNRHTDDELSLLVVADGSSPEVGRVLRFMIECGEEGLMRMIVGYADGETEVMIVSNT
jgi:hypothetical protein